MFIPFMVTLLWIVQFDLLLVGIGLGMVVAIAMSNWSNFSNSYSLQRKMEL